ncbi:DUF5357 family protein [Floridanema evergladense]|uniref:DUF5357 family protein n=1 Tax=Floridaenema evergladense BLCC-F167 TaxID=3153639 RepID=A0ABV4WPE5_9CYAN
MNKLIDNFLGLITLIKPPQTFSWQTLIYTSIFFWIIALLLGILTGNAKLQDTFSLLGCVIIISGYAWFTVERPFIVQGFSLSAWILVGVICLFITSVQPKFASFIWIVWPVLSAIVAAWPEFIAAGRKLNNLRNEQRFKLLIWFLIHLIFSCWIQFSLIIQGWILQYPSLLADDLSQSDFVVTIKSFSRPVTEGEKVLEAMERQLKTKLEGKSWVIAENWFRDTNQLEKLQNQAKQTLSKIEEKNLWKFNAKITDQKTGYNLLMVAEWQGPSSNPQGYLLKKVCQVNSVTRQPAPVNTKLRRERRNNNARVATASQVKITTIPVKVAKIQCQPVIK